MDARTVPRRPRQNLIEYNPYQKGNVEMNFSIAHEHNTYRSFQIAAS